MKNILINSLNGFSAADIPMFIFQLLVAALLVRLIQLAWSKRFAIATGNHYVLMGIVFTFMAMIAKYSVPFAILSVAVIIWMGRSENSDDTSKLLKLLVGVIGIGVGSANVVLTAVVTTLILLIIWFFPNKNNA
jgi:uncharacterized membrane protein